LKEGIHIFRVVYEDEDEDMVIDPNDPIPRVGFLCGACAVELDMPLVDLDRYRRMEIN
jgi:hypothetical protein